MKKTFIAVRDVDMEIFRKFKALSVVEKMKLGIALSIAMENWIENQGKNKEVFRKPKLKPFRWGKGTERLSEQIDEIIYG